MGHGLRGPGGGARCEVAATSFLNSLLPPLAGARPTSTRTRRSSRSSTSTRRRTLTSTWASGATASPDARAACSRARAMVASAMRRCGTSGDDGTAAAERASDSMRNSVPLVAQRSRRRHHLDAAGSYGVAVRYCHSGVTAVTAAAGQQQPQKQPPQEPHLQRGSAAQPACSHRPHSTPSAPLRSKPCRFHSLTASDPVSLAASPISTRRRRRSTAPSSALSGARYAGRTATTAWCVASSARTYRPPRSPATAASCSTRRASKRRAEL